ncbi:MAG: hypothetical protein R3E90_14835 [Marinicella sp.]|nr:hypothetical protein [Xanthomonadales bacterium]
MAYYGEGTFDNDTAFDWLEECTSRNIKRRFKKAFSDIAKYDDTDKKPWSREKIDNFIDKLIRSYQADSPPPVNNPRYNQLPAGEWLKKWEEDLKDEYYSGRYLDEEYGPVEEALAAGEVVALWGGCEPRPMEDDDETVRYILDFLGKKPLDKDILKLAIEAVQVVLNNKSYHNMRKWWLDPDNEYDFDHMREVNLLMERLKSLLG